MKRLIGQCIVALAGASAATVQANTVEYIHTDALGTPVAVTDVNGNVVTRSEYEPSGKVLNRPEKDEPGYTGHVEDAATGMTYMQQRYYDPAIGRFLSVDPVTADSGTGANFNRYWYANNNPYKFTDPDGRASCADKACKTSTIDPVLVRRGSAPPPVNGSDGVPKSIAARSESTTVSVSFVNDNPSGASPNQPIDTKTANMVEGAILDSGVSSVNINSTTGGHAGKVSNHNLGRAVDINRVNGQPVGPANAGATRIQEAARAGGNVRENFGPNIMEKTRTPGGAPAQVTNSDLVQAHQNHVHLAGQQ